MTYPNKVVFKFLYSFCHTAFNLRNISDWVSYSALSASCLTDCDVFVYNWGKISGTNYGCLACNMAKPMGNSLGAVLRKMLSTKAIFLAGHSMGAHIGSFACKNVQANGGLVDEMVGYDPAGPLFKGNNCQPGICECGMEKTIAKRTITYNSDPCKFGTRNFGWATITVLLNPWSFTQPCSTIDNPIDNHVFAGYFCAAIHGGAECFDTQFPKINLNHMINSEIPPGTYNLQMTKYGFPFFCPGSDD